MRRTEAGDAELVARLTGGCEEAWIELYRRYQGRIYRYSLQMSGSAAIAEEATQEAFVAFLDSAGRFDAGRGALAGFLLGIARNKVLAMLGKQVRVAPLEEVVVEPNLESGLMREQVRRAVLALPQAYREAVVLCELQELDHAEAAAIAQCPVGTIKSRLHRAKRMLAERLAERRTGCPA